MSVINGKGGLLSQDSGSNTIGGIQDWRITPNHNSPAGIVAASGGMQVVVPTQVTDWTMEYAFAGYSPPALPGTSYTFMGYNGSERASGSVICESVTIDVDIEGGNIITGTARFGSNGALTLASGSAPTVGTGSALTMYGATGAKARWQPIIAGTAGTDADIPDVRRWSLSLNCALAPYVSSSTAGVTQRTAGNLSASASLSFYQGALSYLSASATRLTPGAYGVLKLYTTASLFYGLTYSVVKDLNGQVQVEAGTNNGIDLNFDYSGWALVSGTLTRGALVLPDTTNFWS